MKKFSAIVFSLTSGLGLTVVTATAQQAPVNLGSNSTFAVLAGTTVTVTGGGTLTGNVGIYPGTAYVPGNPPVTVQGTVYAGGPIAAQAQADLATAFNDAAGRSVNPIAVAGNIGGQTLAPGLYRSTSSLAVSSGDLTLDAQGNANAVWIFQIASTLTTTSGRQVILAGGANAANIFWQVGSSATIGTTSVFQGNILAGVSISMLTGSTLTGRALAMGGAVSLDTGGGGSATIPGGGTSALSIVTTSPLPQGAAGVAYSQSLSATGGSPAYTWSVTGGTLPPGLTLSNGGALTGTPTTAGPYSFTAQVKDSAGGTASATFSLAVTQAALSIVTTSPLPQGAAGVAYSQSLSATGGSPAYTWSVTGGTLPPGLTLSSAGALTGTPTTAGPYSFTAQVKDSAGGTASATFSVTVTQGCTYSLYPGGQAFAAAGGPGTISITAPAGCPWTAVSTLGWVTITGTASGSGSGTATYNVTANAGAAQTGNLTVAGLPFVVQEAGATAAGMVSAGSLSQIVSGGSWNTTITLVNTGATAAEVVLNFIGDTGSAVLLPVTFPQNTTLPAAAPLLVSTIDQTIPAGGELVVQTAGIASQTTVQGWGQLLSNGTVGGSAVFEDTQSAVTQEAIVPLETRNPTAFVLPFDYTGGYTTGVALANLTNQTVSVPVVLRGPTGATLQTASIPLGPYAHTSFLLVNSYPAVAGTYGAMELDTPTGGQISALGIRAAAGGGAITTVPVVAQGAVSNGTMAQVASGGTWQTTFTLVNTSTTAAQVTLNFIGDNGSAMQFPVTFPLTGSSTVQTVSSISQTIGAEAQLLVETAGLASTSTTKGYAVLTATGGNVGGSAVFADLMTAGLQDAVVPLETRNPTAFVLPFDFTGGYTTGIALGNLTNQTVNVAVVLRDSTGKSLGAAAAIPLGPNAHTSFMLVSSYPQVAGLLGTMELDTPAGGQISVLGIRATPGGAITSVPALTK